LNEGLKPVLASPVDPSSPMYQQLSGNVTSPAVLPPNCITESPH